jgi:hypothetical protein
MAGNLGMEGISNEGSFQHGRRTLGKTGRDSALHWHLTSGLSVLTKQMSLQVHQWQRGS